MIVISEWQPGDIDRELNAMRTMRDAIRELGDEATSRVMRYIWESEEWYRIKALDYQI